VPPLGEQKRIADEARRRLAATADQRSAIVSSLERLPQLEREFLALAIAGSLVSQDAADEPAENALRRLGLPPELPSVGSEK
jgi:hypothetical protein